MWFKILIVLAIFLVLDMFWFQFSLPSYKAAVKRIQGKEMNLKMLGTIAWLLLAIGMVFFVLPKVENGNSEQALRLGALYGLVVYGVFNGTNYAMFDDWDLSISIIDTIWGMTVSALTAYFANMVI
jgi:uncharacterized membrane protein